ncbi:hypothetical protein ZYGR_0AD06900 [Zygosaccharomyces rouxii]|uniref:Uncharacterized protein n=1 Tax=Zygosaccharomyces rouxii TaxID=4956 RepID=A0A1Q3A770_ZYGRO|nr:hypothetical protein ZYGR_0AD06900 [Zygosaccharomyces rouxii]
MNFNRILTILILLKFFSNMAECNPLPIDFKKLQKCVTNDTPQEPNQNIFSLDIERKLCSMDLSDPNDSQLKIQLPQALQKLAEVDKLILQATEKYHNQTQILYALEVLLKMKTKQMEADALTLQNTTRHLGQILKALKLMISTSWDDTQTNFEVAAVGKNSPTVDTTSGGNSHPGLKRVLSTGGFVFLIFSTASDVCIVTGGTFCIAVYLAGAGGIVIWLNSIYRTALNIN